MDDFDKLRKEFGDKCETDRENLREQIEKGDNSFEIFKDMSFTVNTM